MRHSATEGKASGERIETWEVWRVMMGMFHVIFGLIVLAAQ